MCMLFFSGAKDSKSSSGQLKRPASASNLLTMGAKREASGPGGTASTLMAKKPKLAGQTFTPLGRPVDDRGRASPSTQIHHYDEIAKEGRQ